MQRYLRPDLLARRRYRATSTPGPPPSAQTVTEIEMAPDGGSGFRMKTRFARFSNVPEMLRMLARLRRHQDRRGPQAARPALAAAADGQRAPRPSSIPAVRRAQLDFMAELGERAEADPQPRGARPRKTTCSRSATRRPQGRPGPAPASAVHQDATPARSSTAADRIAAIWRAHRDRHLPRPRRAGRLADHAARLQLVFCDLGTPGDDGGTSTTSSATSSPPAACPREQVRFIHEARQRPRQGRAVRRLPRRPRRRADRLAPRRWASAPTSRTAPSPCTTSTAPGAPPTSPSARAASCARATRTPRSRSSATSPKASFDAYMWQTVERKARFIAQVMRGRLDVREIEDIGDATLSYTEVKALATGNPLLMDKAKPTPSSPAFTRLERAGNAPTTPSKAPSPAPRTAPGRSPSRSPRCARPPRSAPTPAASCSG